MTRKQLVRRAVNRAYVRGGLAALAGAAFGAGASNVIHGTGGTVYALLCGAALGCVLVRLPADRQAEQQAVES